MFTRKIDCHRWLSTGRASSRTYWIFSWFEPVDEPESSSPPPRRGVRRVHAGDVHGHEARGLDLQGDLWVSTVMSRIGIGSRAVKDLRSEKMSIDSRLKSGISVENIVNFVNFKMLSIFVGLVFVPDGVRVKFTTSSRHHFARVRRVWLGLYVQ